MRPQGSPAELERRRLRAIDLLQREVPVHVVADVWAWIGAPCADGNGRIGGKAAPVFVRGRRRADRRS